MACVSLSRLQHTRLTHRCLQSQLGHQEQHLAPLHSPQVHLAHMCSATLTAHLLNLSALAEPAEGPPAPGADPQPSSECPRGSNASQTLSTQCSSCGACRATSASWRSQPWCPALQTHRLSQPACLPSCRSSPTHKGSRCTACADTSRPCQVGLSLFCCTCVLRGHTQPPLSHSVAMQASVEGRV